jgi:uncharacterized protein YlxW (UPF0749 family)
VVSPFVINAIGNPDYLKSAVAGKGGQVDALKELGHEAIVETYEKIMIEKYNGEIDSRYID